MPCTNLALPCLCVLQTPPSTTNGSILTPSCLDSTEFHQLLPCWVLRFCLFLTRVLPRMISGDISLGWGGGGVSGAGGAHRVRMYVQYQSKVWTSLPTFYWYCMCVCVCMYVCMWGGGCSPKLLTPGRLQKAGNIRRDLGLFCCVTAAHGGERNTKHHCYNLGY